MRLISCLFDELLENYKTVAPGKKEQIFLKTLSVAASVPLVYIFKKTAHDLA